MKIRLLAIGKTSGKYYPPLMDDYIARIGRYNSFEYREVQVGTGSKTPEAVQMEKEGQVILKHIAPQERMILLDAAGLKLDSPGFSGYMDSMRQSGTKQICFVIGGPYGFSPAVRAAAADSISLSAMTFTHQMVRLIFLEQLYRAFTILNNEPYHHS